jgi:soluble lytic murein transglycosylase-like protein
MRPHPPLLASIMLLACAPAHADMYMAVGADGTLTLTDVFQGAGFEVVAGPASAGPGPVRTAALATRPEALPFASIVAAAAAEHGLPEALIHAVIRTESNYDPAVVSPKGAVGLMQLMPGTARELGVTDARDPAANIRAGTRYLKRLLGMFGNDVAVALAAYNAGPAAVTRHGGRTPPYDETRRYVPRVIAHFERLNTRPSDAMP